MTSPRIHGITIKLPFLLRWMKRFVTLEHHFIEQKASITGQGFELVIIDEGVIINEEERRLLWTQYKKYKKHNKRSEKQE